jgi:DNA-binding CsgD family transcriptional regulator
VADLAADLCPDTPEHAQALARLAFAEVWNDEHESAARHASEAVGLAHRTGSTEALAWALCVRSQTRADATTGLSDLLEAIELANDVGDPEIMGVSAVMGGNCYERLGRLGDAAELMLTTFRRLVETNSVHDAMWARPEAAAAVLIDLGRWAVAREVLRELLSRRHPPWHAAEVRGVAALLAFRSGDLEGGRAHLSRARELAPGPVGVGDLRAFIDIEGSWVDGEMREALAVAADMMPEVVALGPGSGGDELLLLAARVAASLAEQPGGRKEARELLDQLERIRGTEPDRFAPATADDLLHPAWGLLFAAERARCHGEPDTAPLWRSAVSACAAAGLVPEKALASYQLARALLADRRPRREAASALRQTARLATELGAAAVLRDVEELARQAHVPLDAPPAEGGPPAPDHVLSWLTPREQEVLTHLMVGRTYPEIAQALFISEKTVSAPRLQPAAQDRYRQPHRAGRARAQELVT